MNRSRSVIINNPNFMDILSFKDVSQTNSSSEVRLYSDLLDLESSKSFNSNRSSEDLYNITIQKPKNFRPISSSINPSSNFFTIPKEITRSMTHINTNSQDLLNKLKAKRLLHNIEDSRINLHATVQPPISNNFFNIRENIDDCNLLSEMQTVKSCVSEDSEKSKISKDSDNKNLTIIKRNIQKSLTNNLKNDAPDLLKKQEMVKKEIRNKVKELANVRTILSKIENFFEKDVPEIIKLIKEIKESLEKIKSDPSSLINDIDNLKSLFRIFIEKADQNILSSDDDLKNQLDNFSLVSDNLNFFVHIQNADVKDNWYLSENFSKTEQDIKYDGLQQKIKDLDDFRNKIKENIKDRESELKSYEAGLLQFLQDKATEQYDVINEKYHKIYENSKDNGDYNIADLEDKIRDIMTQQDVSDTEKLIQLMDLIIDYDYSFNKDYLVETMEFAEYTLKTIANFRDNGIIDYIENLNTSSNYSETSKMTDIYSKIPLNLDTDLKDTIDGYINTRNIIYETKKKLETKYESLNKKIESTLEDINRIDVARVMGNDNAKKVKEENEKEIAKCFSLIIEELDDFHESFETQYKVLKSDIIEELQNREAKEQELLNELTSFEHKLENLDKQHGALTNSININSNNLLNKSMFL